MRQLAFITCGFTLACAASARADLVVLLAPTAQGGVQMWAEGTSIGTYDGGGGIVSLSFLADDVFGDADVIAPADWVFTGTMTIGGQTADVTSVTIDTTGAMDSIDFGLAGPIGSGEITATDLLIGWSLASLPFESLMPGTFQGEIDGVSASVYPAPGGLALLVPAMLLGRVRRRG